MFAHRERIYYRGIGWGTLLATLGMIMFPTVERGMAQIAPVTLGSLNSPPASTGVPFPMTPVGSTSAALTLPLQINRAGTEITGVSAAVSQGGKQEFALTSVGCALNTALSAGTICNVKATFTPAYIVDSDNYRIREVSVLASELNFATTPVGFTSLDSPQTAMVSNTGNSPLVFSVPGSGLNPSISAGFALSNSSTCQQLDMTSSASSLGSGDSCTLVLSFIPVASGPISGTASLADNALGLAPLIQTIHLNAVGLPAGAAIPDFSIAVSPSNQSVGYGATAIYAVSVTGIYNFSGPVALAATGLPPGATLTINSGTVTVSGYSWRMKHQFAPT
jgi:hypothetical protein